jgi:glycosyltransferase involved in cell wall biosynthesis
LVESVPPRNYGGTERVVSYLTEELVKRGHEVTLFASGDSITSARLVSVCDRALRLDRTCNDPLAYHFLLLEEVFARQGWFDLVHFHVDYLHFPLSSRLRQAHATTLHGRLDLPELAFIYRTYRGEPVISISTAQRRPVPWANWQATVYHGLPMELYRFHPRPQPYLAFLGRVSPEKRLDRAIEIAKRSGLPLKVAAKVDAVDRDYFEGQIKPLLNTSLVEFLGELGGAAKEEFLGNAAALLFPVDWPEPFGLAMIEALACGVPVVGWRCGSVPEVLDDGLTGFVVDDLDSAVEAVHRIEGLSRPVCRRVFEERFAVERMCDDYLQVYERLLERSPARHLADGQARRTSRPLGSIAGPGANRLQPDPVEEPD